MCENTLIIKALLLTCTDHLSQITGLPLYKQHPALCYKPKGSNDFFLENKDKIFNKKRFTQHGLQMHTETIHFIGAQSRNNIDPWRKKNKNY